ncbi:MAG: PspC domain-containing protein [Sphaerochaetaceae bacterium]|nr:PspC domain-containing protein [Sphaerochaetaceae bacterium]
MATKRLYRAKDGEFLGVCKGIAQWKDFPVDIVRLVFIIIAVFTGFFPCLILYIALAFFLPVNPYSDGEGKTYYYKPEPEDFVKEEDERRNKETDWDNRFSNS